ncbi:PucR family transcriptional regulator [Kitasatospora phosalacinea]|uniref:PucR family transcriptional regulator n=1 Tax=Kitasatospora phosalacinea TaxID=2065 RepID=A0ABW6GRQ9_9ACTN
MSVRQVVGHGHAPPTAGTAVAPVADVQEVLQRASDLVRGRVADLAAEVMGRLREAEPFYRDGAIAPKDSLEVTERALLAGLDSIKSPGLSSDSARLAWQIGVRRARQGAPLPPLLRAYRLGGEALWERLVQAAADQRPQDAFLMARAASSVWALVDRDCQLMADAYRETVGEFRTRPDERVRALLDVLVDGRIDDLGVAGAATELGVPVSGRFAVAVVRTPLVRQLRSDRPALAEPPGVRLLRTPRKHGEVVIAFLGGARLDVLTAAFTAAGLGQVGISPVVDRLAAVGRGHELAALALRTCTRDQEVASLDARLPAGLVVGRPDLAGVLLDGVLGAVLALDPGDREPLLATLAAWIECGGSARSAGARLYCHRNTVLNRLRRLEQITGRCLDRPQDLVELVLALEAFRTGTSLHS